ncbi:hypothetical protein AB0C32_11590, partial [Streptosporangium sp. NPDC048865]
MNLREHRIPVKVFSELAHGGGGAPAIGRLSAAQYSKHVLLVRGVMETARTAGHAEAAAARRAYDLLAAIQRRHPGAVDTVLRHSSVGEDLGNLVVMGGHFMLFEDGTSGRLVPGVIE